MPEVANALDRHRRRLHQPALRPFLFGPPIIKHYTDAKVSMPLRVAMVSEDWYKKLADKDRKTFDEGVAKANAANRAGSATAQDGARAAREGRHQDTTLTARAARASRSSRSPPIRRF